MHNKALNEVNSKLEQGKSKLEEALKRVRELESDKDREIALREQKIEYMQKSIKDFENREMQMREQMNKSIKDCQSEIKEITKKNIHTI